jgi:molybdenum cofactor synthesis domain-containing protein
MREKNVCNVEIIATGDELLYGRIVDTNSNWIAKRIVELGGKLKRITTVGDDLTDIGQALIETLNRENDVIVFTGGLGPSQDDLTVNAIGNILSRRVVHDPVTVEKIKGVYKKRGISDTSRGEKMARILDDSTPIPNPVGFSVGMKIVERGKKIFTLPGVPQEMKPMFNNEVAPIIEKTSIKRGLARTIKVRMVWKDFFPLLWELQKEFPEIYLKNAATPPMEEAERNKIHENKVDIIINEMTEEEAEKIMDNFLSEYQHRIDLVGGGEIFPIN